MNRPTVVIVEDEDLMQKFLGDIVGQFAETRVANSVAAGMCLMREVECSVLLLDLILNNSKGIEALNRFRDQSGVPIVVITGVKDLTIEQLLRAGATEVLFKPVSSEDVLNSITRAIARHE